MFEDFCISRANGEWTIVSTSLKDEDLQNTRPDGVVETNCQLDYIFILERRPAFYAINILLPIILSSFLTSVVFLVPIHAGEKVSYILTLILAIAVLLTLIADSLPHTSLTVSVLGIYLAITMFFSVLSAVVTVLLLGIFHNKEKVDTTSKFYKLTLLISTIICWEGLKIRSKRGHSNTRNKVVPNGAFPLKKMNQIMEDVEDIDKEPAETSVTVKALEKKVYTWEEIANIWDQFCFRAVFTLTLICTFSFLVTLALGDKNQYV
ncbi:hypothetical protein CHS0354_009137 [Potamilus streckersoni]|uniref:Neurotransmitter-gated ion-channel transmembrane domain-containing protein n=1 Tax=Potamilus streckersoni TaxID=2493646 RepID=A0AAE0W0V1_9BIVA|nr:hypothetical protein CHS0354_009137 [Potamilus streckersoni]